MEYGLGGGYYLNESLVPNVLILLLMEYGLGDERKIV